MNAITKPKPTEAPASKRKASRDTSLGGELVALRQAYNGLEYHARNGVHGGNTWLFYKTEYDEDVPLPDNLPSIVPIAETDPVLYYMIPKGVDFPDDDAPRRASPGLLAAYGSEAFIPAEADDLVGGDSFDNDKIINSIHSYEAAVEARAGIREAAKMAAAKAEARAAWAAARAASIEAAKSTAPNMLPLIEAHDGLEIDISSGGLDGGDTWKLYKADYDADVPPPTSLPSIVCGEHIFFLLPGADVFPPGWKSGTTRRLEKDVTQKGVVFIPAKTDDLVDPEGGDWDDEEIVNCINTYENAVGDAREDQETKELLAKERNSGDLFASVGAIDETPRMMVEDLFRDRGVSVVYGHLDEFKTTYLIDMAAHIAAGADFQGRKVEPRPVVIYALDDPADDIRLRLRAIEASLRSKDTPWGDYPLPITVRDRIPEDYREWRLELAAIADRFQKVIYARDCRGEMPWEPWLDDEGKLRRYRKRYCWDADDGGHPLVMIDTVSIALGGEDEKGPGAVKFVGNCLDLLKDRPDNFSQSEMDEWGEKHPNVSEDIGEVTAYQVASHVILAHHPTKTGDDFAGHRGIAANTSGLHRIHRFGKMSDANRSYSGQITPLRTKGMPRPAPMRFEVEVVPVEGTKRTAAILKDMAAAIPEDLLPVIDAVRELGDHDEITLTDLNECLDVLAAQGGKDGPAKRKARQRLRDRLEDAGVLEGIEDDTGKVTLYCFHDVAR